MLAVKCFSSIGNISLWFICFWHSFSYQDWLKFLVIMPYENIYLIKRSTKNFMLYYIFPKLIDIMVYYEVFCHTKLVLFWKQINRFLLWADWLVSRWYRLLRREFFWREFVFLRIIFMTLIWYKFASFSEHNFVYSKDWWLFKYLDRR